MASDRTNRTTGDPIKCNLPTDVQAQFKLLANEVARKEAKRLESAMTRQLKMIPVWQLYLQHVFGVGPVVAAYLVSEIDIFDRPDETGQIRAKKPSALRKFCGMAVVDGRLERRAKGIKSSYSSDLRTCLFNAFSSMWKNGRGKGRSSKYLDIWVNAKHRKLSMASEGRISNGVRDVSANGYAHSYGWHKAADVLLEDLYTVWRAIEGLDVWPSYYAAKLGYEHGGKISVNAPKRLTVDEALAIVGDVSGRAHEWNAEEKAAA
jgi:hypothetical protein